MDKVHCALDFYETALQIHLKFELTKKPSEVFHAQDCDCPRDKQRPEFISNLLKIEGVVWVDITRHTVYINKNPVFKWDEMIESIVFQILASFSPNGELVQTQPAREYYRNIFDQLTFKEKKLERIGNPYRIMPNLPPGKNKP